MEQSGELAEWSKATVSKIVILLVGIEGSNPSLSAIFILKRTIKNHRVKQRANSQARLAICSFYFTPAALSRKLPQERVIFKRVALRCSP